MILASPKVLCGFRREDAGYLVFTDIAANVIYRMNKRRSLFHRGGPRRLYGLRSLERRLGHQ